jgi:hypothetical protein
LAASAMAKISCNINAKELLFVFNSDSEEQCTSNISDIQHGDDVATKKVLQDKKTKTGIQ